jgi:hypothetical protein
MRMAQPVPDINSKGESMSLSEHALIERHHKPEFFELVFNRLHDLLQRLDLDLDLVMRRIPRQNAIQIDGEIGRVLRVGRAPAKRSKFCPPNEPGSPLPSG